MSPEYFFTSSAMAWWYGDRAVSSERASFIRAGEALAPPPPPPPRGLFEPGPPPSSRTESRRCIFPSDVDLCSRPEGDAQPGAPGGGGGGRGPPHAPGSGWGDGGGGGAPTDPRIAGGSGGGGGGVGPCALAPNVRSGAGGGGFSSAFGGTFPDATGGFADEGGSPGGRTAAPAASFSGLMVPVWELDPKSGGESTRALLPLSALFKLVPNAAPPAFQLPSFRDLAACPPSCVA